MSVLAAAVDISAQDRRAAGRGIVEGGGGYAEFIDESPIHHAVAQASARVFLGGRIAVGPELTGMRGRASDRDWLFTGNVTIDLLSRRRSARWGRPYLLAGAGWGYSTLPVGTGRFSSREGAFTTGGGTRFDTSPAWYLAPEFRIGWEPHWRATVVVGRQF